MSCDDVRYGVSISVWSAAQAEIGMITTGYTVYVVEQISTHFEQLNQPEGYKPVVWKIKSSNLSVQMKRKTLCY